MKRLVKILAAGLVVGGLEVGAIALLAFQANAGQFQDLAFSLPRCCCGCWCFSAAAASTAG